MKTRLFLSAVAFMAIATIASAQTVQQNPEQIGRGRAAGNVYVDADKDGVCDNYTNGTRPGRRAYSAGANQTATNRGPGMGLGLARGPRNGQGRAQGVVPGKGIGRATGTAPGRGRFNGRGPAFVDTNNNGVCDNIETAPAKK